VNKKRKEKTRLKSQTTTKRASMFLDEFIKKYNLKIDDKIYRLCQYGIKLMSKSRDPLHNEIHIYDILSLLDVFIQNKIMLASEIDFRVLLPAIIWHDIWKSRRPQTVSVKKFMYEQLRDGIGSARIFHRYAAKMGISPGLIKNIKHCISRHSAITSHSKVKKVYHPKRLEARILKDLDRLTYWSERRQNHFKHTYCTEDGRFHDPRLLRITKWLYKMSERDLANFYFEWADREFKKRREPLLKEAKRIIDINER